jgi:tetratricopeptide (TPR) repeat protein
MADRVRFRQLRMQARDAGRSGDLGAAIRFAGEAVDMARGFGQGDADLPAALNMLGDLCRRAGRLDQALAAAREGVSLRRESTAAMPLGNDLMFLAQVLEQRAELGEALECAREALPLYERTLGEGHSEVGLIRGVIARLAVGRQ